MEIKVLGPGCPKCKQTEQNVKNAIAEASVDATVEKVTDVMEIAGYGVFGTPAVVIDGEVKSVGKIPSKEDVKEWLKQYLPKNHVVVTELGIKKSMNFNLNDEDIQKVKAAVRSACDRETIDEPIAVTDNHGSCCG